MKTVQKFRAYAPRVLAAGSFLAVSAAASAAGLDGVSDSITEEIAKVVPIISAVGMALLSVGVVVKAFRLVQGFLGR